MPMMTIYHILKPTEGVSMYEIDAKNALGNFPSEWFATADAALAAAEVVQAAADSVADSGKAKK